MNPSYFYLFLSCEGFSTQKDENSTSQDSGSHRKWRFFYDPGILNNTPIELRWTIAGQNQGFLVDKPFWVGVEPLLQWALQCFFSEKKNLVCKTQHFGVEDVFKGQIFREKFSLILLEFQRWDPMALNLEKMNKDGGGTSWFSAASCFKSRMIYLFQINEGISSQGGWFVVV